MHNLDPGPKYNVGMDMTRRSLTDKSPPSCKISKAKLPNFIDSAVKVNKFVPGVGKYSWDKFVDKQIRVRGTYTLKSPKSAFIDSATYHGMQTPFRGDTIPVDKFKMDRSIEWKI